MKSLEKNYGSETTVKSVFSSGLKQRMFVQVRANSEMEWLVFHIA